MVQSQMVKPSTIWLLYIFLGWSYGSLGKIGLQILFYLTGLGFIIGYFIRLFTLSSAIRKYNKNIALKYNLSNDEMIQLGII